MPDPMARPQRKKLGETLVEAGLIDDLQLRSALADQKRWGNRLGKTLVKLGFVEEEPLMRQLSKLMGYPLAEIRGREVDVEVLAALPRELAEKYRCLPLFVEDDGAARYLYLGMEEPADLDTLDALQLRTGFEICPVLIGFRELDDGLRRFYGVRADARVEPEWVPTGELVGPECLRHGDEALVAPPEPPSAQTSPPPEAHASEPAPEPETATPGVPSSAPASAMPAGLDPEESFEVGVTVGPGASEASPRARASEVSTRRILKALTQVLVEKGILTREELVEQVNALAERDDG